MIKLTIANTENCNIWINPEHIRTIAEQSRCTRISFENLNIIVCETPKEILKLIGEHNAADG